MLMGSTCGRMRAGAETVRLSRPRGNASNLSRIKVRAIRVHLRAIGMWQETDIVTRDWAGMVLQTTANEVTCGMLTGATLGLTRADAATQRQFRLSGSVSAMLLVQVGFYLQAK